MLKGQWGLKSILKILGIMAFSIMISMMVYNKSIKHLFQSGQQVEEKAAQKDTQNTAKPQTTITQKETTNYKNIKEKMSYATEKYINLNYENGVEVNHLYTVTLYQLVNADVMNTVYDPYDKNTECSGYVNFIKKDSIIHYNPYLKCGNNYQSDGYNASLDE